MLSIARDGQNLGSVEADKVPDYLDSGYLLKTDFYYDESTSEWRPITQFKSMAATTRVVPTVTREEKTDFRSHEESVNPNPRSSRNKPRTSAKATSRAHKQTIASLAGWVACLFALGAAAGIWAWAQSLNDRWKTSEAENQALDAQVEQLKRENQALTEIAPPKHVRGVIAYQMSADQVGISSGVTVAIYPRAVIEKSLNQVAGTSSGQDFQSLIEGWRTLLPSPTVVTMTDANGRFDVTLPDQEPYVLVTSANRRSSDGSDVSVWLTGVRASDSPTPLMLLNEKNAISPSEPQLTIKELTPFAAGPSR